MPKVNAKASDGCTALAFALDCTSDDDRAIECAKLPIRRARRCDPNSCCFEVLFLGRKNPTRIQTCELGSM